MKARAEPTAAAESLPVVFVVDDDPAMRDSLRWLLESTGARVETYGDAQMFLGAIRPDLPGVIILDVRMPGMSGLDLQAELVRRGVRLPTITRRSAPEPTWPFTNRTSEWAPLPVFTFPRRQPNPSNVRLRRMPTSSEKASVRARSRWPSRSRSDAASAVA